MFLGGVVLDTAVSQEINVLLSLVASSNVPGELDCGQKSEGVGAE